MSELECAAYIPEKVLARQLDGEFSELTTLQKIDLIRLGARAEGIVVAFVCHDDLLVFDGAICDEVYIGGPWIVRIDGEGLLPDWEDVTNNGEEACQEYFERKRKAKTIELIWRSSRRKNLEEYEYELHTDIPHEVFSIVEDGKKFSRGIVFRLSDVSEAVREDNQYSQFANREYQAAGWCDENGTFNDEMQEAICKHVEKLLEVFHSAGHSGSSAQYTIDLFSKLAKFEPITPLTGEDWEWNEICDDRADGVTVFQNKRCSHVFKQSDRFDGQAYDIDGKVFWEWCVDENGEKLKCYFTSGKSHVPVTFPYTPKTEYVEFKNEDEVNEETVTISKKEYGSLIEDRLRFSCLVSAGVDDWSGYEFAMEEFQELADELE